MMKQYPQIASETERITLKEMSIRDESHYNRLLREGQDYLRERYGKEESDEREEESEILGNRARILASIGKYETRNSDGEWGVAAMPPEYMAIETFVESFPRHLYTACALAAIQLNWPQYAIEKKGLTAAVDWLTG